MEELNPNDLIAFFNKLDIACPVCKGKDWAITPSDHKIHNIYIKDGSDGFPLPPPTIPAIAAICMSCGYMSMHEYAYLQAAVLRSKDQQS